MKIVINNAIINTDWFPVITTENNILLFGYESDFNTPIHVYFPSEEDANAALVEIAKGLSEGKDIIEIEGGSFEPTDGDEIEDDES